MRGWLALKIGKWRSCATFLCEEPNEAFPAIASEVPPPWPSGLGAGRRSEHQRVSDYAASADQVTSVTQPPTSIPPTGLSGLANLVETYGCVAGYPNAPSVAPAMTRYEAVPC